ncbi:MAG: M48 family metalloprotease [Pyrinomonadaceae bacterium]|nr:M48 family metalloprotease [Pyrinomonadaceae bacterium]
MKKNQFSNRISLALLTLTMLLMPLSILAQTKVSIPKNKYPVSDDVKLGGQASNEVAQKYPILRDSVSTQYVQSVGDKLVDAIPSEYLNPAYRFSFQIVNDKSINAFALPGGSMYVNTGMIIAAKTEGEMAGVMAHELSHVVLRHSTAQLTKQNSAGNQILGLGAILGGAILGGQQGAQLGAALFSINNLKYSREYETQSDILGAQIMARAGYDPRDLANMFRTIQGKGSSTPQFMSSHPNPANRYERINQEAALLRVSGNPIGVTNEFTATKQRLGSLPANAGGTGTGNGTGNGSGAGVGAGGNYSRTVQTPSTSYKTANIENVVSLSVPNNWQQLSGNGDVTFAPSGAFGDSGITHGALVGVQASQARTDLQTLTQNYISGLLQSNNYLRQQTNYSRTTLSGRNALATTLSGTSPITGRAETVTIYTTQLRNGGLLFVATVAPEAESGNYNRAFNQIVRSLQVND